MMTKYMKEEIRGIVLFIFLFLIVIIVNFPVIIVILNSFKTTEELMSVSRILPEKFTLRNYRYILEQSNALLFVRNSFIIAVSSTLIAISVAALAGYSLSRFKNRFSTAFSQLLLMLQMFPLILVLIPLFILFRVVGLINTHFAVIIIYTTMNLPFAVWMSKSFFDSIPKELEEAAWIDGYSHVQTFLRVVLPLSKTGISAVGIFAFIMAWNEFLIANVFLRKESLMTIPIGIQMFIQQYQTDWGSLMASATFAMIPAIIFLMFIQKYIAYTVVGSAVKG